jgi:ubiquinone/menaquinone biosynthesis C-methylase UbiE
LECAYNLISPNFQHEPFDYATISFVLHEMSDDDRIKAVNEMHNIAKSIIIADFTARSPEVLGG